MTKGMARSSSFFSVAVFVLVLLLNIFLPGISTWTWTYDGEFSTHLDGPYPVCHDEVVDGQVVNVCTNTGYDVTVQVGNLYSPPISQCPNGASVQQMYTGVMTRFGNKQDAAFAQSLRIGFSSRDKTFMFMIDEVRWTCILPNGELRSGRENMRPLIKTGLQLVAEQAP